MKDARLGADDSRVFQSRTLGLQFFSGQNHLF